MKLLRHLHHHLVRPLTHVPEEGGRLCERGIEPRTVVAVPPRHLDDVLSALKIATRVQDLIRLTDLPGDTAASVDTVALNCYVKIPDSAGEFGGAQLAALPVHVCQRCLASRRSEEHTSE